MKPQDADPLTVPEIVDMVTHHHGWVVWDAGFAAGRRISRYRALIFFGLGVVVGSVLTLILSDVAAAPRSAQAVIPDAAGHAIGNPPGPTGAPASSTSRAEEEVIEPTVSAGSAVGAPLSGIASWYPARGLIAAAGPGLRHGHWRGSSVVVSANGRAVTVELLDWCRCDGGRLIDLSDDAFARLAPLSRGLVRVQIAGVGPAPTLPPTDGEMP